MKCFAISLTALLALSGSAFSQWSDDFNRPNGPIGGSWTPVTGTWDVINNQGAHTSTGTNDVLQHSLAVASYASTTTKLDVISNAGTTSYYAGVLIGLGGTDTIMVKIQDQSTTVVGFSNIGIYHRTSATGWGAWTGVGTGFATLSAPFVSGQITVFFPNADTIQVDIDTDFNGTPDQTYTKTGVSTIAANLGLSHGLCAWQNVAVFDNWDLQNVPQPPSNDACASAAALGLGTGVGTTVLATNDGSSSCDTTGNDVWYSYTAPSIGGSLTIDTCGSAIDTVLSVYDACGGNLVACDDNSASCGSGAAQVVLALTANQSYRVRVSDKGVQGNFTIRATYAAAPPCNGTTLSTLYTAGNGGSLGGQVFFDLNVTKPSGITINEIDINAGEAFGTVYSMSVYTIAGTYVGNETNSGAWTLASTGAGVLVGANQPSNTVLTPFTLPAGTYGVALVLSSTAGFDYTNGNGTNQNYSNADLAISLGAALNVPWTGTAFTPRVFNGGIRYDCGGTPPTTYCTGGTTTNGCVASISADNQPSVSAANACNISVANVEGQKSGLIFYSITGQAASPWNATSFLCVKAPTQRTPTQNSGGTVNACDGTLALDWNAFQASNPGSLGNPWSAGDVVQVQAWFRDPPAGKATNLSNAVELTYQP